MGRPSKLTPELQDRIVRAIRAGNYASTAVKAAGIAESTFYRWLSSVENDYQEFQEAVQKAEAEAEQRNVAIIESAAPKNWQAAAWWLERKFFDRWGRKERRELSGLDGGPFKHVLAEETSLDYTQLTMEELQTLERLNLKAAGGAAGADNVSDLADPGGAVPA